MVGVATGAIPLYLALLTLALPKDYRPGWWRGILFIVPGAVFLAAAAARRKAIAWRRWLSTAGVALFAAGAVVSIVVVVMALRVEAPARAPAEPIQVRLVK